MEDEKIISYLKNELLQTEMMEVEKWIGASEMNEKYFNRIKFLWENSAFDYQNIEISSGKAWDRIHSSIIRDRTDRKTNIRITLSTFRRIAAIAIIMVSVGVLITWVIRQKRIAGIEWINTATTDDKVDITLPDRSHTWLNTNSGIYYPNRFIGKSREIYLTGEAFFNIKNKRKKPFIIHAHTSEIRVLGTSFNVESGKASPGVVVTVVSGRVTLCDSTDRGNMIILEPGDQGINLPDIEELVKRKNDDANFMAWKTGILVFENTHLEEVCKTLSGHFSRSVTLVNDEILKEKSLTATFDNRDIEEILKILEITLDISCTTDKGIITLSAN